MCNELNKIELMEHNISIYDQLIDAFNASDVLLYVTATGTGKSYVASKYIQDTESKALVICPKTRICDNWMKLIDCDTMTYHKLYRYSAKEILSIVAEYDILILDEAHHAGAIEWSKNIHEILNNISDIDIKILGLTADPTRYSDSDTDVTKEIFNNNVIYGYTLEEAIQNKILPTFTYVSTLFDYPSKKTIDKKVADNNGVNKKVIDKLIGKLNFYNSTNAEKMSEIVKRHLPVGKHKIIVFVSEINDIDNTRILLRETFKDANIYSISSKKNIKRCTSTIREFENDGSDTSILISVDMLNEGLHIKNVDTIIMMRKTSSPSIFFQQIGRALSSTNMDLDISVFDFVANACSLKYNQVVAASKDLFSSTSKLRSISDQIIVIDYASEDLKIIETINNLLGTYTNWTEQEDDILRRYFEEERFKVSERLPGRTVGSIRERTRFLGIHAYVAKPWTDNEKDILKQYYPIGNGVDKCLEMLPNRTASSIKKMAIILGLKKTGREWTPEEDAIIRKYYKTEKCDVSKRLNRTRDACRHRAKMLGLSDKYCTTKWTQEEDDILREYYTDGIRVTRIKLPHKSDSAIRSRARLLGMSNSKKWTQEEDDIIIKYYPIEGDGCVNRLPNRTVCAVNRRLNTLGISKVGLNPRSWSDDDDNILRKYYGKIPAKDIVLMFNANGKSRTEVSIRSRAKKMKLRSQPEYWSSKDDKLLIKYYDIEGRDILKRFPDRTWGAIKKRISQIKKRKENLR
jgi:superfamily II DNA or RNA helicase